MLRRISSLFRASDRNASQVKASGERNADILIRAAERRDLDTVVDMIGALVVHHDMAPNISAEQLAVEALGECPSIRILVAESDAMLVGYILLHFHFNAISGRRTTNIDHLFVVTEQRAKGIGKRLVEVALDTARGVGSSHVSVQSEIHNWAAHAFYAAAGFAPASSDSRSFWRSL